MIFIQTLHSCYGNMKYVNSRPTLASDVEKLGVDDVLILATNYVQLLLSTFYQDGG